MRRVTAAPHFGGPVVVVVVVVVVVAVVVDVYIYIYVSMYVDQFCCDTKKSVLERVWGGLGEAFWNIF